MQRFTSKSILAGVVGLMGLIGICSWGIWGWIELWEGHFEVLGGPLPLNIVLMLIALAIVLSTLFFLVSIVTGYQRGETINLLKSFFSESLNDE